MRREQSDGLTWSPDPQDKIERPIRLSYRWITGESLRIDARNGRRAWWSPPFEVVALLLCLMGTLAILIYEEWLFGGLSLIAGVAVVVSIVVWRMRVKPNRSFSIDLSAVNWKSFAKGLAVLLVGLLLLAAPFETPMTDGLGMFSFGVGFCTLLIGALWVIVVLHE